MWWAMAVVALVVAVATYLTWLAARVDRLHGRAATAGRALDAHLVRRAAAAAVLAEDRLLPDLYTAARAALDAMSSDEAGAMSSDEAGARSPDEAGARSSDEAGRNGARPALSGEREAAENDLTRRLRSVPLVADDPALLPVVAASRRVALARQVHTDLVRDARALRGRPVVRLVGLARRHPLPAYFDVDDPTLDGSRPAQEVG